MEKTAKKQNRHVPIAWVKNYGQGRAMHMSLGHNEAVGEMPQYMDSMLGGVKWILGMEPGDATPNPELSSAEDAKAKATFKTAPEKARVKPRPPKPAAPAKKYSVAVSCVACDAFWVRRARRK